jgi:hypothetical protein
VHVERMMINHLILHLCVHHYGYLMTGVLLHYYAPLYHVYHKCYIFGHQLIEMISMDGARWVIIAVYLLVACSCYERISGCMPLSTHLHESRPYIYLLHLDYYCTLMGTSYFVNRIVRPFDICCILFGITQFIFQLIHAIVRSTFTSTRLDNMVVGSRIIVWWNIVSIFLIAPMILGVVGLGLYVTPLSFVHIYHACLLMEYICIYTGGH